MRRYPWDEFWTWASARGLAMNEIARRIGSDRRELYRWREAGGVPETAADRVAVKLGVTPCAIWPAWHEIGLALAAEHDAQRRAHVAATKRRYWQTNPDYAERQRAKVQRWKEANPEKVRRYHAAYQREWRAKQGEKYRAARAEYQRRYRLLQAQSDAQEAAS